MPFQPNQVHSTLISHQTNPVNVFRDSTIPSLAINTEADEVRKLQLRLDQSRKLSPHVFLLR